MRALRIGDKWTAVEPNDREKHFEIVGIRDAEIELRCVLTNRVQRVERKSLADPLAWLRDWR